MQAPASSSRNRNACTTPRQGTRTSTSPARQQSQRRRRLSIDESMAAAGLFVLAQRQVTGDDAGSRGTNETGIAPVSTARSVFAQQPAHVPTHLNVDKAAAQSLSTRKGRRRLPHRESGKINDGLQPQISTRDAIVKHQHQHQHQHHLDAISKAHSTHDGKPQSSLSVSSSGTKTPLAVGIGKSVAPAKSYQQPHRPDVFNRFLLHSAHRASVTSTMANETSQLHTNQQLLSLLQKRRIEEMLRNSSTIATAAGTIMSPYTALQSQLQIHPPAKRVKVNPLVASVPLATSASQGQCLAAPKKRILARKAHIDAKHACLAPEEEVDPLSGSLINTVQDYYPHEDESAKNENDRDCTTALRARSFTSSHLGRTAVPQSGYGNLPSWRSAKRNLRNPSSRAASDALTRILPSLPPITDSNSNINKTRGKISALM